MKHDQDLSAIQGHHWAFEMSFSCVDKYDQFVNWLSDEFYFFQQDQGQFLTIYFPNGQIKVKNEDEDGSKLRSKLTIESKCRHVGLKIKKKLSDFLNHIERYHILSQI
ncbi:hypothetical protein [Gelidibacter salicanalis]|uniref:Uncharacterized protein n=1 Tax=Gelidibacter salicanalis TaxID=291193 RepID=A0A934KWU1_9FLAO|nr:hypothetical protein [Gelidibacter salicanalis]MBJ7882042.1 hypothetical protein [Gelidibacter salicanalis]